MNKFNILILGKNGFLAKEIQKYLTNFFNVITVDSGNINNQNLIYVIKINKIDIIINCIAIVGHNKVNANLKMAIDINSLFPKRLSEISEKYKCRLIHFSTNSIFDGNDDKIHFENDRPNPLTNYGKTKYEGELAILNNSDNYLIVRLSHLYSLNLNSQRNILNNLYYSIFKLKSINININEFFTPISTELVAQLIYFYIINSFTGIRHLSEEKIVTWDILINEIISHNKINNVLINYNAKNNFISSCLGSRYTQNLDNKKNIISTIRNIKYD